MQASMTLKFNIVKQNILRVDPSEPVEGSLNYLYVEANFDATWQGLYKKLIVQYGNEEPEEVFFDEYNKAVVPFDVIRYPGFAMNIVGLDGSNDIIVTTIARNVKILKSGAISGGTNYVKDIKSDSLDITNVGGHYKIEQKEQPTPPGPTGGGVVEVETLPEHGDNSMLYKLPDGSVWSWFHTETERQVKVIDVPAEHVQLGQFYKFKYHIDIHELLTFMNKHFQFVGWNGDMQVPEVMFWFIDNVREGTYWVLQVLWSTYTQNIDTGAYKYLEPDDNSMNALGFQDQNEFYCYHAPEGQDIPLNEWSDNEGNVIPESEFNLMLAVTAPSVEDLEEAGFELKEFDIFFDGLQEEVYHYETVIDIAEGYRRIDDDNYVATKATISEYDLDDSIVMNGEEVDYDESNSEIIITDNTSYIDEEGIHLVSGGTSGEGEWIIKPIKYVIQPTKQKDKGKLMKFDGTNVIPSNALPYITEEPTSDNSDGLILVVIDHEPSTKYNGYLYIITEPEEENSGEIVIPISPGELH